MAYHDGSPALLVGERCNELGCATGQVGGQRRDGFVEEEQALTGRQGAQERNALGLARRELPCAAGHDRAEFEALDDACLSVGPLLAKAVGGVEMVAGGPPGMKRCGLRLPADGAEVARNEQAGPIGPGLIPPAERPGLRRDRAGEEGEQGGLAGT